MSLAPLTRPAEARSPKTRVMVVDDSAVIRGLIARWLSEAGDFEVVATLPNGRLALEALARTAPDIVLLDLEMPDMDGIEALPLLLAARPGLKVVVISTLTQRNAEMSIKCLSLGAVDYLPKPEGQRQMGGSADFRRELVEKLKALAGARGEAASASPKPAPSRPVALTALARPRCLLIGASTGGPRAVEEVLMGLGSAALRRIPVLLVQHMPATFTGVFAQHLRAQLGMRACEAHDGEALAPGTVYVAPGGRHMGLAGTPAAPMVRLDDGPPVNYCRPAVDVLFFDAAALFGATALAVVLTGMGADGTQGARALVNAGGAVLAQDEASSTVWGMPGSIVKAGLAGAVLPLPEIGPALKSLVIGTSP